MKYGQSKRLKMIEIEYVHGFWAGWVDGQFVTIHRDLDSLMKILREY